MHARSYGYTPPIDQHSFLNSFSLRKAINLHTILFVFGFPPNIYVILFFCFLRFFPTNDIKECSFTSLRNLIPPSTAVLTLPLSHSSFLPSSISMDFSIYKIRHQQRNPTYPIPIFVSLSFLISFLGNHIPFLLFPLLSTKKWLPTPN